MTAKLEMLILWLFADLWERAESQRHVATFKRPKQRVQGVGRSEDTGNRRPRVGLRPSLQVEWDPVVFRQENV